MVWIISAHLFIYGQVAIENLNLVFTYAESWYVQPLFAVAISVDTFFVIRYALFYSRWAFHLRYSLTHSDSFTFSGLVLAYLFFQTEKKKKKESAIVKFFSSVINRYLR